MNKTVFVFLLIVISFCKSCVVCQFPEEEDKLLGTWKISNVEHPALDDELNKLINGSAIFGYQNYEIKDSHGKLVEQGTYVATDTKVELSTNQVSKISNSLVSLYEIKRDTGYSLSLQTQTGNIKLFLIKYQ